MLDLNRDISEKVLTISTIHKGGAIKESAWSSDETVFAAWLTVPWQSRSGKKGGLYIYNLVVDLERKEITFFRKGRSRPIFLIDNPEVVEAIRARSVPWH